MAKEQRRGNEEARKLKAVKTVAVRQEERIQAITRFDFKGTARPPHSAALIRQGGPNPVFGADPFGEANEPLLKKDRT